MKPISIHYIAKVTGIPPRTISLNIGYLLDAMPELKELMEKNNES